MNIDYALSRERRPDFRYRLKRRTKEVLKIVRKYSPSFDRLLDLGTAEGKMLLSIRETFPGALCLGIDYSFPLLLFGKKRFSDLQLICADVENLNFIKEEVFDIIVATALIEHLKNPRRLLSQSYRLLRNQGILILTTPNPVWEKVAKILGFIKGEHLSVMGLEDLMDICQKERFVVLESYGFMLSPIGIWEEEKMEALLRKVGFSRYLPNQLVVARKI